MTQFGATPEEWQMFIDLGLINDLLPVVCNPNAVISPRSSLKKVGKTPSVYNADGQVSGIGKWTDYQSTLEDVQAWSKQPDYGICVQTRRWHGVDVDCDNLEHSRQVAATVERWGMPIRMRQGSTRFLTAWIPATPFKNRNSVKFDKLNIVEFYGIGKQFIAVGTHPDGSRYEWIGL